jgi:hypothetical protein
VSYARLLKSLDLLVDYFNNDELCLPKDILKTDKYKVINQQILFEIFNK